MTCLERYRNRAVVGAVDVGVDRGGFYVVHEFARDEKIINAPADVAVAGVSELVPIGVGIFSMGMEMAE